MLSLLWQCGYEEVYKTTSVGCKNEKFGKWGKERNRIQRIAIVQKSRFFLKDKNRFEPTVYETAETLSF